MRVRRRALSRSDHHAPIESEIDELRLWAISAGASCWIVDLRPYEGARIAGVVRRLRIEPLANTIEALVWDGTGAAIARWRILRPTPHLRLVPGRHVLLEGVPWVDEDHLVILEPRVELISAEA